MALSTEARRILAIAMGDETKGAEVADHLDAVATAAAVAPLGTTTDLTAIGASFADLAAARTAVDTLATEVEARLDAIEAKVDALIAALAP